MPVAVGDGDRFGEQGGVSDHDLLRRQNADAAGEEAAIADMDFARRIRRRPDREADRLVLAADDMDRLTGMHIGPEHLHIPRAHDLGVTAQAFEMRFEEMARPGVLELLPQGVHPVRTVVMAHGFGVSSEE